MNRNRLYLLARKALKPFPFVSELVALSRKWQRRLFPQYISVHGCKINIGYDNGMRSNYLSPGYYSHLGRVITQYVAVGDVVVDAGAHVGLTTILMSLRVGASGQVLAFEPSPASFALLQSNIRKNMRHNVSLFPFALGKENAKVTFYANESHSGFNSRSRANASFLEGRITEVVVKATTLDSVLSRLGVEPSFIKMDCQGSEYDIVQGLANFLGRTKRCVMYVEFWPLAIASISGIDPAFCLRQFEELGLRIADAEDFCELVKEGAVPDSRKNEFIRLIAGSSKAYTNLVLQKTPL